jgi:predicted nucleic acid-binding protein
MGLILDSSVLIAAERQGKNARQVLTAIARDLGEVEVGISVVTLIELAHGASRADTPDRKSNRHKFIEELLTAMPVYPVTVSIASAQAKSTVRTRCEVYDFPLPIY